MKSLIYIIIAALLIGGGYYLEFIHSSVSEEDQALCEASFREQFASDTETLNAFLPQCKNATTIVAMQAQGTEANAEEVAQKISAANRQDLLKTIAGYALIGGGIGALAAAFLPKKNSAA